MTDPRLQQVAWVARMALALVFVWHGLVPKILGLSPDELMMIQAHGLPAPEWVARMAGAAEILLGGLLLMRSRRWPVLLAAALLVVLLLDVSLMNPHLLLQAFNPLSTNLAALTLCWVVWRLESEPKPPLH